MVVFKRHQISGLRSADFQVSRDGGVRLGVISTGPVRHQSISPWSLGPARITQLRGPLRRR